MLIIISELKNDNIINRQGNKMNPIKEHTHKLNLITYAVALGLSLTANVNANESETQAEKRSIEVINITATREVKNLQEVPLAVTAFSSDELAKMNITDLGDLESQVPNLSLHSGDASNAVVYIRGVGQIDSISFNDPGVGVYLDDVYLGRVQGAFLDVVDPEQIEVLRGPQGTLYGRNTIGGAVKFTSSKPTEETQAYMTVSAGNYNSLGFKGSVSGSLYEDVLMGRFAISKQTRDGYVKNLNNNQDDNDKDTLSWRGSLLYKPSDNFSAYLVLDGSEASPNASRTPHRETPIYSVVSGQYIEPLDNPFTVNVTYNDLEQLKTKGSALTLSYLAGNSEFKSITSYREMEYRTHLDLDATTDESFGIYSFEDQSQLSQELQWIYQGDKFSVVSGLYYFKEDDWSFGGAVAPDFYVALAPEVFFPWPVVNAGERVQENSSTAAYANVTYSVTDKLDITLGGRFTNETKDVVNKGEEFFGTGITSAEGMENAFGTGGGYNPSGYEASETWKSFTPKLVVDYQHSKDSLFYFSASEGFKSGGFNGRLTSYAQPFDPETLWSYEVGSKLTLNNDSIKINSALFYNDYENFQLSRFSIDPDTGAFLSLFENAGKATMYGAEMELHAIVTDNLDFNLNVGYLGGGYDQLTGDFEQEISDERELVNAPKWNSRLGIEYFVPMDSASTLSIRTSLSFRSKTYLTASSSEVLAQPSYSLWDMSVNWVSADDHWTVNAYIKNITDEQYREHGFDLSASPGVQLGYYGAPRNFGANVTYRF